MTPENKDRLLVNVELLHKKASNWVVGVAGTVATLWFAMPSDTRQAILEHSPLPLWAYPIVGVVATFIASILPQKATAPEVVADKLATKAAKREEAEAELDPFRDTQPETPQ